MFAQINKGKGNDKCEIYIHKHKPGVCDITFPIFFIEIQTNIFWPEIKNIQYTHFFTMITYHSVQMILVAAVDLIEISMLIDLSMMMMI